MWYGVLFVLGFILGYWIFIPLLMAELQRTSMPQADLKKRCQELADRLTWYLILGAVIGARLGHVLFYDLPTYQGRWLDIFKIWEGGLASHGGAIGIIVAVALFRWRIAKPYPQLTMLKLLDLICIPTALAACLIRIGNFINQEILGTVTTVPWAVVFEHAADGSLPIPRHPVQLYEAVAYLMTFFVLLAFWRYRGPKSPTGALFGIFLTIAFAARIFLEGFKEPQSLLIDETEGMMGQYLSFPFLAIGVILLLYAYKPYMKVSRTS